MVTTACTFPSSIKVYSGLWRNSFFKKSISPEKSALRFGQRHFWVPLWALTKSGIPVIISGHDFKLSDPFRRGVHLKTTWRPCDYNLKIKARMMKIGCFWQLCAGQAHRPTLGFIELLWEPKMTRWTGYSYMIKKPSWSGCQWGVPSKLPLIHLIL